MNQHTDTSHKVSLLLQQLGQPDLTVRRKAALLLKDFPSHSEAVVPALVNSLTDPDRDVVFNAICSLGNLGTVAKASIPDLKRVMEGTDPALKHVAGFALELIEGARANLDFYEDQAALSRLLRRHFGRMTSSS